MHNPIKQSKDHDSEGVFIKQWVPELKDAPVEFIHEPWKLADLNQETYAISKYYPPKTYH